MFLITQRFVSLATIVRIEENILLLLLLRLMRNIHVPFCFVIVDGATVRKQRFVPRAKSTCPSSSANIRCGGEGSHRINVFAIFDVVAIFDIIVITTVIVVVVITSTAALAAGI